ncbi:MAG: NAD(P)H-hydrate dehydratase [Arcobacter sp.]|nr:NAD(P)H-hydrate dehydratase [Arcobacter sp.]
MKKLFDEVNSLDKRCYEKFALSEDILMEHAANSMAEFIQNKHSDKKSVLIVCGSGNNGADGIALARLLYKRFEVSVYLCSQAKSQMAILQEKRAKLLGVNFVKELKKSDIIVDCIFGTGLNKTLNEKYLKIIDTLNSFDGAKISCDIPSGLDNEGRANKSVFKAHTTITMGALKTSLYSDMAKDYVGDIIVANLGVQREIYEDKKTNTYLLEESDLILPFRHKKTSHKGNFGHLNVIIGDKKGAGIIACEAAFAFGCGLVSAINDKEIENLPHHIMQNIDILQNCTALALGMGLGKINKERINKILEKDIPILIDADLFYDKLILKILNKQVVLTPHPKEFCSLLKLCNIADLNVEQLQRNRLKYVQKFCEKYPRTTLVLKGANVIIGQKDKFYINTFGTSALSKGGSGDVLGGFISSLLAQGYSPLNASISGSLSHSLIAKNYEKNNYSLSPQDLIQGVKIL